MSYIIPDPRFEEPGLLCPRHKPINPVQIDWDHPLAKGLVGFWLGGDVKNYVTGERGVITGATIDTQGTQWGSGWINTGNNTTNRINLGSINSGDPLCLAGQTKASFFHLFEWGPTTPNNQYPRFIDKSSLGSGANGYATYYDTGTTNWYISIGGSNLSEGVDSESPPTTNTLWSLGITVDLSGNLGNDIIFYTRGAFFGDDNTTETAFPSATTNAALLNWNHSTDREMLWPVFIIAVWSDRTLTAEEHASLWRDPYQFLIPA